MDSRPATSNRQRKDSPAERWARWKATPAATLGKRRRIQTRTAQRRLAQRASVKARRHNTAEKRKRKGEARRRMQGFERAFRPVLLGAYQGGIVTVRLTQKDLEERPKHDELCWRLHLEARRAYFMEHPEAAKVELEGLRLSDQLG